MDNFKAIYRILSTEVSENDAGCGAGEGRIYSAGYHRVL